jgi:hypothetical protein
MLSRTKRVYLNGLHTEDLRKARDNGEVVVANHQEVVVGWFVSPLYTFNMPAARALLPAEG